MAPTSSAAAAVSGRSTSRGSRRCGDSQRNASFALVLHRFLAPQLATGRAFSKCVTIEQPASLRPRVGRPRGNPMSEAVVVKKDWWSAFAAYLTPRMLVILAMGFASGLPLLLTLSTLTYWLSKVGVDKTTIGLFALVGTPYTFKFLWSPFMDQTPIPILTRLLGRRRSWLLVTQALLAVAIFAMGLTDPAIDPLRTAIAALVVAFLSASQDIVIDAYRIDILPTDEQGHGAAATQVGYRIGLLLAGAGALALSDYVSWPIVFAVLSAAMAVAMIVTLLAPEPKAPPPRAKRDYVEWVKEAFLDPFIDFMKHRGWILILVFVLFYKFGDALGGFMA